MTSPAEEKKVCVVVDCHCEHDRNWPWYPKDINGIYRVPADHPKAKIGHSWVEPALACKGLVSAQSCDDAPCRSAGEVVAIITTCKDCPHRNQPVCPLPPQPQKLMTMAEALTLHHPDMAINRYLDAEIIDQKCPKCGAPVVCAYADLGCVEYYDNYAHICLNRDCDHHLHQQTFECNMGGRANEIDYHCIFCGREVGMTG